MTDPVMITVHLNDEAYALLVRAAADMKLTVADYAAHVLEIDARDRRKIEHIVESFAEKLRKCDGV